MTHIAVEGVSKEYRSRDGGVVRALSDVSLTIDKGEFVTLVGASGCGKTTLLKILAGILPATSGSVCIAGKRVTGPQHAIGMVFQAPTLLEWRTILENVMLPIEVQKRDRATYRKRALELLELVGLEKFADKYPNELSGGMQQRAGICRALVHDPDVLLMDEPFGALDALTREEMNLELQRIWMESAKTVVMVTHSIAEAVLLSDRAFVFSPRPGRLVETLQISKPRPRSLDFLAEPEAMAAQHRIRALIGSKAYV